MVHSTHFALVVIAVAAATSILAAPLTSANDVESSLQNNVIGGQARHSTIVGTSSSGSVTIIAKNNVDSLVGAGHIPIHLDIDGAEDVVVDENDPRHHDEKEIELDLEGQLLARSTLQTQLASDSHVVRGNIEIAKTREEIKKQMQEAMENDQAAVQLKAMGHDVDAENCRRNAKRLWENAASLEQHANELEKQLFMPNHT